MVPGYRIRLDGEHKAWAQESPHFQDGRGRLPGGPRRQLITVLGQDELFASDVCHGAAYKLGEEIDKTEGLQDERGRWIPIHRARKPPSQALSPSMRRKSAS